MSTNYTTQTQKRKKGKKTRAQKGQSAVAMGDSHLSLRGFLQRQVPDVTLIKMVYSDYRPLVAAANQASYVYRLNSCFDPDQTGVGGQPDGFDQWKTLYSQYRVVACDAKVHVAALAGAALCTMTPSVSATVSSSAEEQIGLRRARGQLANVSGQMAKLNARYRISDVYGIADRVVLDEDNYAAPVTGNPNGVAYLRIEAETSGAADTIMVWTTLTMYTRFEKPVDTQDSVRSGTSATPGRQTVTRIPSMRLGVGTVGTGAGATSAITGGSGMARVEQQLSESAASAAQYNNAQVVHAPCACCKSP